MNCPKCNQPAKGKFCSGCGTPLGQADCPSCGQAVERGAHFCHSCGATIGKTPGGAMVSVPWIVAGAAVVVLLIVVIVQARSGPPVVPPQAGSPVGVQGGGTMADLASMPPREQANRLFDRVMIAHEQGDLEQAQFFIPMAVQSYATLGALDGDARYHLGLIHAIGGNPDAARAQADSLDAEFSGHLMAQMIYAMLARLESDTEGLQRAYTRFLANYDAEMASDKSEYTEHATAVENFRSEAASAAGTP